MKKLNLKSFIAGVFVTVLIMILTTTVFGAQISKAVTAVYRDIKVMINGEEITPKDASGNPVEPFIVDGTTYLPVRAISDAVGYDVAWDDKTNTVKLTAKAAEEKNDTTEEESDIEYYKPYSTVPDFGVFSNQKLSKTNSGVANEYYYSDYIYDKFSEQTMSDYYDLLGSCGFVYDHFFDDLSLFVYKKDNVKIFIGPLPAEPTKYTLISIYVSI